MNSVTAKSRTGARPFLPRHKLSCRGVALFLLQRLWGWAQSVSSAADLGQTGPSQDVTAQQSSTGCPQVAPSVHHMRQVKWALIPSTAQKRISVLLLSRLGKVCPRSALALGVWWLKWKEITLAKSKIEVLLCNIYRDFFPLHGNSPQTLQSYFGKAPIKMNHEFAWTSAPGLSSKLLKVNDM